MDTKFIIISVMIMAVITYCTRMIPLALIRKKIQNRFVQSFLLYMPYGVLSAMVFPAVFSSTANLISAIAGTVTALILAYLKKGLLPAALSATIVVFIFERIFV